ncbi:MAG: tRNA (adenosine(37)-N6)-threonylcarbamoyltransferase complex dimerization subunit type 1 TsaB [Verrucomicrobiales bacterium]|nr:tRNA (adenosine(37)-N6)-threonylcarbamoyltransferase complex dimerization subunit type 1 TsaB [Verrucomicrobiales bacterium]
MILALETSTPNASLALWDREENRVVWEAGFTTNRSHNSKIFVPVEEALGIAGDRLEFLAVGIGPGSYTGVRVAIAVANGLSFAREIPAVGISSLEAFPAASCTIVGDARRKSFFRAEVSDRVLGGEPDLLEAADFAEQHADFEPPVVTADQHVSKEFATVELAFPTAAILAGIAAELDAPEIEERSQKPLEPHYLRPPYITTPKPKPQVLRETD